MPIFNTEVSAKTTDITSLALIKAILEKHSFVQLAGNSNYIKNYPSLYFKRQAKSIYEVTAAVLKAVKETGKDFSFTIIKSK